jgi:hypothetical protein
MSSLLAAAGKTSFNVIARKPARVVVMGNRTKKLIFLFTA